MFRVINILNGDVVVNAKIIGELAHMDSTLIRKTTESTPGLLHEGELHRWEDKRKISINHGYEIIDHNYPVVHKSGTFYFIVSDDISTHPDFIKIIDLYGSEVNSPGIEYKLIIN